MKLNKLTSAVLMALVYAPWQVMAAGTEPTTWVLNTYNLTIFAKTYITTGASSVVKGTMVSGTVLTTGSDAQVDGTIMSVAASNVGDGTAIVGGNMVSGGVATVAAGGTIRGHLISSGAATIGANASVSGNMTSGGIATTGASATVEGTVRTGEYASIGADSAINVLMHASLEDSFGAVLAEAMAIGLPVVAGAASGAVSWLVGEAGCLVDVTQPESIATALQRLLTHIAEAHRLGQVGSQRVRSMFSAAAVGAAYEGEYEIGRRSRAASMGMSAGERGAG